ncbi:putative RNA-directed DNA polymerase from transposon X-element [Trichonephila clavipes]|nr:putative RNA-directed DNA polymerase from transposon X-element [Trichonephila clavipes]
MKNVWQEKPGARAQNSTPPQQLYSAAVKKNTNHDFDVSQVMSQMSQMMTHWNANGLKRCIDEFKDTIIDYNPDVIGIQETHLRPADRVSIPNYTCHRSDRTTHRGGGTAIFVKNSIRHHAIVNTSNTFENTSVILHVGNNTKITVACIYRPPHGSINTIQLDAILNHSNKAFLFGDFNAKHSSWNPGRYKRLRRWHLKILISVPTQGRFLDLPFDLYQRISATNREPTFTVPPTNHNSAIQTIQDFTAETVCKKISDSVATPPCHVRPTNKDTHSQAGPPT